MRELAKIALDHGFKVAIFSGCIMVWDQDGAEAVTNLKQLKIFMGY